MAQPAATTTTNVFVSYRHQASDEKFLNLVLEYLKPLEDEGLIGIWTDRDIEGGQPWRTEIFTAIEQTEVAVLLISQAFFNSNFIKQEELPRLLARSHAGQTTILPVFLSPFDTEHSVSFTTTDGLAVERRLAHDFQGYPGPGRTLDRLEETQQRDALLGLNRRIRALAGTTHPAAIDSIQPERPAPTTPSTTVGDGLRLLLTRTAAGDLRVSAHPPTVPALLHPPKLAQALVAGAGLPQPGDPLFALLFGPPTHWEPLFRNLFGSGPTDPQPNPTRGPVRLSIATDDPALLALPWQQLAFKGQRLIEHGWRITTASPAAPARDLESRPGTGFLVIAPAGEGANVAGLIDELWSRGTRTQPPARRFHNTARLDDLLDGMRPHGVYVRAACSADGTALRLADDGSADYRWDRFASQLRAMDPPPAVLMLDLAAAPSTPIIARLVLDLGARIPLILWRARGQRDADDGPRLLKLLRRWLGGGEDPVAAWHALLAEDGAATGLAIHAHYRHWQTHPVTRWQADPLPQLALDRDRQKNMVAGHVRELARSQDARVMALLAYGSAENRLAELHAQLGYHLEIDAADAVAIAWQSLSLPEDRTDLRGRLQDHLRAVLRAAPDEPLDCLLRRLGPRGLSPGVRGLLWLDWGVLDNRPARAWPRPEELAHWLAWCAEALSAACPAGLRIVCGLALELPEDKYPTLTQWFMGYQQHPWYLTDRFRCRVLDPLGRVDADHLFAYLASIDTGLDQHSRGDLVRLILARTSGAYDATVALLHEGRETSWSALLKRLAPVGTPPPTLPDL